jgi:hypothetical protein
MTQKNTPGPQKRIVLAFAMSIAAAFTIVLLVLAESSSPGLDSRESARGVVTEVTVTEPVRSENGAIPAQPRPGQLPPVIAAEGDCKVELDKLRDFMEEVPSGLMPRTAEQDARFNTQMAKIVGTTEQPGVCSTETVSLFRAQEISSWLTWAPPASPPAQEEETATQ